MKLRNKATMLKALFVAALVSMTACQQTTEEVYTPKAQPTKAAPVAVKSVDGINTELATLQKSAPAAGSIGEVYKNTLTAQAKHNLHSLTITDKLPANAEFVKAEPAAQVSGNTLTWTFSNVAEGATKTVYVYLKPTQEGTITNCATLAAVPQTCVQTVVGKADIAIQKDGPALAQLNSDVVYTIVVTNTGTAVAKNVVVTDNVPAGLTHASGKNVLAYNVGDLAPKASKNIQVTLKAAKRGTFCNVATADASNTPAVKDDACTKVVQSALKIAKTGLKKQFIGKKAGYTITVTNPGDVDLKNVVVTDAAPAATTVLSASDNGTITGNNIVWNLPVLKSNATKSFTVNLTSKVAGNHCNQVSVKSAEGLTDSAQACTVWKGHPALLLEVVDTIDPLLPGEETTYIIRVTNQGTAADTNVSIAASFPAEISPVTASGSTQATINGKSVSVAAYPVLEPKKAIEWKVKAKAISKGDSRLNVSMKSDLLSRPVKEEESTHVY